MPDFVSSMGTPISPWGVNEFLRSTKDFGTESYMCAKDSVPFKTRDGNQYKELRAGTVMAKITAGPNLGMIGPFEPAGVSEVQRLTGTGTFTSGNYKVTFPAFAGSPQITVPVAAVAADIQTLVDAAFGAGEVVVTGGPVATTPVNFTYQGDYAGDEPAVTVDVTAVVGGGTIAVTTPTAGTPGSDDGRGVSANIVGLLLTTLPWQLMDRDVEVSVVYDCEAVQGWCIELDAAGVEHPLSNATAAFMQRGGTAGKMVDIGWH